MLEFVPPQVRHEHEPGAEQLLLELRTFVCLIFLPIYAPPKLVAEHIKVRGRPSSGIATRPREEAARLVSFLSSIRDLAHDALIRERMAAACQFNALVQI